jgi:hypothetical protein
VAFGYDRIFKTLVDEPVRQENSNGHTRRAEELPLTRSWTRTGA